jgi:NAD(P)-dependent dehydrogenase (short-subunit alcohol dehydrogenase family)
MVLPRDVGDRHEVHAMVERVAASFDTIDVLVNNAPGQSAALVRGDDDRR